MLDEVRVLTEFFPPPIYDCLVRQIERSTKRKQEFVLRGSRSGKAVPDCVRRAASFAEGELSLQFNFAILKWYRVSDTYESKAYEVHRDPERLQSIPLFLCTLKGLANLIYWRSDDEQATIPCSRNTVILLRASIIHRVTPPLDEGGERYLFFLGLDTSLPG